jgi:hypothetical protein
MAKKEPLERHNINLSRQVWGELKLRSFQEGISASELVTYVVEVLGVEEYRAGPTPKYQPRNPDEDRLGRTVFFRPDAWKKATTLAKGRRTSVSALIEHLLRRYLGLLSEEEQEAEARAAQEKQYLRIGEERVYLGENPIRIDLKNKPE